MVLPKRNCAIPIEARDFLAVLRYQRFPVILGPSPCYVPIITSLIEEVEQGVFDGTRLIAERRSDFLKIFVEVFLPVCVVFLLFLSTSFVVPFPFGFLLLPAARILTLSGRP